MTPEQIAADITRGAILKARIKADTEELKAIEKRLEAAGLLGPHIPLQDASREGKRAMLKGDGKTLPVIFESDLLIASFKADSPTAATLKNILAANVFEALFKEVHAYERRQDDGQKFRIAARKAIPDEGLFIDVINLLKSKDKAGITKSKTSIAWDQLTATA